MLTAVNSYAAKRRAALVAAGFIFIVISAFMLGAKTYDKSPKRADVDILVYSFIENQRKIEEGLSEGEPWEINRIAKKMRQNSNAGQIYISSSAILILSDSNEFLVLIELKQKNPIKWKCSIYPSVHYESLCSKINKNYQM